MKPREPRRKVFVPARLRLDGRNIEVRVLDVSSRGFRLQADAAPARGSYVELTRGRYQVVARVVWSNGSHFGALAQDRVCADRLLGATGPSPATPDAEEEAAALRRATRWADDRRWQQETSVLRARALEFGWIATGGGLAAAMLVALVGEALAQPLRQVVAALG